VIVDLHSHYLPLSAVRAMDTPLPVQEGANGALQLVMGGHTHALSEELTNLERQRETMARQGLDQKVLAIPPFLFQYELPAAEGVRWSRMVNDGIAEAVQAAPEAFVGFATLPLQDMTESIRELDRAVEELGLAGIEIATNINGVELDAPALHPLWERAAARRLPILIHPHYVAGASRMGDYHLRNLIGNPAETALAGSRLLFGGVLERYPDLALILSHGGGALPHLIGRLTQGYRVRPECRLHASSPAKLLGAFYFDTIVFDPKVLRHVVDTVGADRIILGTDYPFDMSDDNPVTFVRTADLTEDEAQAILAGGAQLLGRRAEAR
jgi:aminocarboxymuconate-semialdehyde decarboxylase